MRVLPTRLLLIGAILALTTTAMDAQVAPPQGPVPGRAGGAVPNLTAEAIIPFVEANYSVLPDRDHRGIAGMSMGSGQALNIGLTNLDRFAWLAVVAPAPNTRPPAELIPNPAALAQLKLFWLSVGNRDALYRVAQGLHTHAADNHVSHIWRVDTNAHDTAAMSSNFYHFAQKLFRD